MVPGGLTGIARMVKACGRVHEKFTDGVKEYARVAPKPEEFPALLDEFGEMFCRRCNSSCGAARH